MESRSDAAIGPTRISLPQKRVLQVMRMTGVSGAENHLLELTAALVDEGWASDTLILDAAPDSLSAVTEQLAASCERVELLPMRGDVHPRVVIRLARSLRSGRYDVAHAHLVHADWYLAAASVLSPWTPLVSTKHNDDPFRRRWLFRVGERLALQRYAAVISISQSLRDFTQTFGGISTTAIHYGLRADESHPSRRGGQPGVSLLGVGRLERQKGFDVALEAMKHVAGVVPSAHLAIAGEGSQRPLLEELIRAYGLEEAVSLLGRRENVDALMRDADILVHPARWEGFGLVLLEAMRAGLPIIATHVGAIPEVVAEEQTGLLVPSDDPRRLAAAIIELAKDADRRHALGAAGLERLRNHFSTRAMARATAAVYDSVLASGPAPRTRSFA